MPRITKTTLAQALSHGIAALLEALRSDDVVLVGRWSRVLALVHAEPTAPRACGA